jgi:hypothetical protein
MVTGETRGGDRPVQSLPSHPIQGAASSWDVTRVARSMPPDGDQGMPTSRLGAGDLDTVGAIIRCLDADPAEMVTCPDGTQRALADALSHVCDIDRPAALALEVLASRAPEFGESRCLQALAEGYPGAEPADADLLDLLYAFPSARPPVQELVSALAVRPTPGVQRTGACRKERRPRQNGALGHANRVGAEPVIVRRGDDRLPAPPGHSHHPGGLWARLQHGAYVFVRAAAAKAPFARAHKAG